MHSQLAKHAGNFLEPQAIFPSLKIATAGDVEVSIFRHHTTGPIDPAHCNDGFIDNEKSNGRKTVISNAGLAVADDFSQPALKMPCP